MSNTIDLGSSLKVNVPAGLQFPATAVADADPNTLDDYEEGTFTPTITFGGAAVGVTYVNQAGAYTKIGNRVFFTLNVSLTNKGSSAGGIAIGGLPFASSTAMLIACSIYGEGLASITGALMCLQQAGTSAITIYQLGTGTPSQLTNSNATNSSAFLISGHYAI